MLIPRFREPKLPKYDLKAGQQIFDKEHDRSEGRVATIAKDTQNPIDIRLRQMTLESTNGCIDIKGEFLDKWVVATIGDLRTLHIVKGRIKDMYLCTRDLRMRPRKGQDIIVSFDRIMSYQDREP